MSKAEHKTCLYVPLRGSKQPCKGEVVTDEGFCKEHCNTAQARREKERLEKERRESKPSKETLGEEFPKETDSRRESPKGIDSARKGIDSARKGIDSARKGVQSSRKLKDDAETPALKTKGSRNETDSRRDLLERGSSVSEERRPFRDTLGSDKAKPSLVAKRETELLRTAPIVKHEEHSEDEDETEDQLENEIRMAEEEQRRGQTVVREKRYIKPNKFGWFEDKQTNIVFGLDHIAFGVQDYSTGKVCPLGVKEIEICKKNKWKYRDYRAISSFIQEEDESESSESDESDDDDDDEEAVENESEESNDEDAEEAEVSSDSEAEEEGVSDGDDDDGDDDDDADDSDEESQD